MPTDPSHTLLIVNPGSTSTKIAVAEDDCLLASETLRHPAPELEQYKAVWEQFHYRLVMCRQWAAIHLHTCAAVVARGGLLRPLEGGTYRVTAALLNDARANVQGEHASNLGSAIADELARDYDCPAFIVDPVSVNEFEPLAKYSGVPLIERRSLSHALSIHATGRRAAHELNIAFENSHLIVAHLGGGISVAPLRGGKIIDVNDAASDGPFSPECSGGLPLQKFASLCFSGKHSEADVRALIRGRGGLVAYLGTNDLKEVEQRVDQGDNHAREVFEAMAYQIAKEIGAMATVLHGRIDGIVLTGGAARSRMLVSWITERVRFIAPVLVFAGEDEMQALALGALRVLRGVEEAKLY